MTLTWQHAVGSLAGTVLSMAIGAFWHSPYGFLDEWMRLNGIRISKNRTPEQAKQQNKEMKMGLAISAFSLYVQFLTIAVLLTQLNLGFTTDVATACKTFATLAGIWFAFTACSAGADFAWNQRAVGLLHIFLGHTFVTMIAGTLLSQFVTKWLPQ
ncbi:hypothetical protein CAOG_02833 [Capsaspora owczarzaki ATCC 30864]|nr:hypothetical protein CAOG_02833 [Capsaspora owczarzaki ATCC 30864]|eukprot:XP_004348646.1 hypothetical protein CAOG_02833 [Capsaspora owczarzaki ATCC 30864]